MKRALLASLCAVVLVLLAGAFFVARALRAVDTPEFKESLLREARARLGTDVQVSGFKASLWRGFRLEGVRIASPSGWSGDLVSARSFVLGYDLWPLLRGRLHIDELVAEKPEIRVVSNGRGAYNYERLKPYADSSSSRGGAAATGSMSSFLRAIEIKRLAVKDGSLTLVDGKTAFLRVTGQDFESRFVVGAAGTEGKGRARIAEVALADALFLRGIDSPIVVSKEGIRLAPIEARLAKGKVGGDIGIRLEPDLRWSMNLKVDDASVETLLKEAGARPSAEGELDATATLSGTGGVTTIKGKGAAQIDRCKIKDQAVLVVLAGVLQLPELAAPRFDECRLDFEVGSGVVRTSVLRFKGPEVELTGNGRYGLATTTLDYDLTLGLSPELLSRIPGNTTRAAFKKRDDGFGTLDFKVTGTSGSPKVDLLARLGQSLAIEAAKEGLRKLFERKKQ